ncbi:hypothetical protein [Hymenobacter sp. GOD-10R]|uniref:hypothetical protein n=1 Tax=Hymenobacter sp. GOD-10R TaxID=3093922 RepID=UPI002D78AC7C|nr:hypothetical protein [Hymenobacter sp. GOD-10R]WRQ27347.1 hypothetical protein SD425_19940 [Hymenobacter sp. GOD-10R]
MRSPLSCRLFLFIGLVAASCSDKKATSTPATLISARDESLTLGNPSGATTDASNYTNYLLIKPQYTLSYHRDRGIPNWVS